MKVILQQDVKDHGKKGQMVEVSDGYARNFLFPRKLAVPATADNINAMKLKEKARLKQIEEEKAKANEISKKLESCVVKVAARAGENGKLFGSVTSKEISEALESQCGISIEKNRIVVSDPIKAFGSYQVKCKLGHEISGVINVLITETK
ncbi:MAG: 50S ribosomal protein L9 [Clostridiales bacterium]|nr:50S ribosomal protein L9 [Clostridiales bacterium]